MKRCKEGNGVEHRSTVTRIAAAANGKQKTNLQPYSITR